MKSDARKKALSQQMMIYFSMENGNRNKHLGTGFSYVRQSVSAVKRVEDIGNRMPHIK
jgi:hypothetical protein